MANPIGVATADVQASYATYAGYPAMWGDSYHSLTQCVDYAKKYDCPLWLCGDIIDSSYPDSYTMLRLLSELQRTEVLYIQGNHEVVRRAPWLALGGALVHMHGKLSITDGEPHRWIYGIDYQPPGKIAAEMAAIPKDREVILLVHQAWEELMGSRGDAKLADLVPDNVPLVISGDFHGHRSLRLTNKNGKEFVFLSPGSTNLRSISEDPVKYCYLIYDDLTFRSLPIENRRVVYSQITTDEQVAREIESAQSQFDAIARDPEVLKMPANLHTPMWVVQVYGGVETAPIKAAAANRAHLFLRPVGKEGSEAAKEEARGSSFEEVVHAALPEGALRDDVLRLWSANEPKEEFEAIIAERRAVLESGGQLA